MIRRVSKPAAARGMLTIRVGAFFFRCGGLCTAGWRGLSKENSSGGGKAVENSMEHPPINDATRAIQTHLSLQGSDVVIMAMFFLLVPEALVEYLATGCLDYDQFGRSGV